MSTQEMTEHKTSNDDSNDETFIGDVIWFHVEHGYGFIAWTKDGIQQEDMFCHFSDISIEGFKFLKGGQRVSFSIGTNNSGKPKAINVQIIR